MGQMKKEEERMAAEVQTKLISGAAVTFGILCIGCMCFMAKQSEFNIKYKAIQEQLKSERQKYAKLTSQGEDSQGLMDNDEDEEYRQNGVEADIQASQKSIEMMDMVPDM